MNTDDRPPPPPAARPSVAMIHWVNGRAYPGPPPVFTLPDDPPPPVPPDQGVPPRDPG